MRRTIASTTMAFLVGTAGGGASRTTPSPHGPERVVVNDNRAAAGTLRAGVLSVRLEVREGEWHPDRESDPGTVVHAFGEEGKPLRIPGPLIRVSEGTEVHAFIRNTLHDSTLTVYGLGARPPAQAGLDTLRIRPGEVREIRFTADSAGTYYYWGTTTIGNLSSRLFVDAELSGVIVVDPRGTAAPPRDRIFVLGLWAAQIGPTAANLDRFRFTINGKAWPNTERLSYTVGDSVRFRIVNLSAAAHPMHLHGFYFDVVSRGDRLRDTVFDRRGSPHFAVTERVTPGRTFTMTWVPDRAGNWMFHCHESFHVLRNAPLDGSPLPLEHLTHVQNHAEEMMGGLVMGIDVRPKAGVSAVAQGEPRRRLRLTARVDSTAAGTDAVPAYGYVLSDDGDAPASRGPLLPGPTIVLKRGEPVSITVVNELTEPTSVHWHGIELESYFDGVAGFAGRIGRLAPAIAPGDSFEARFTPRRSGTFMYHPHADEVRQLTAGMSGALVVVDDPATFDPEKDIVLLVTVPRRGALTGAVLLNGSSSPKPLDMHVGEHYRLRVMSILTYRPSVTARLARDSTLVTWRAVAKDGMDLPTDQATVRPSTQTVGNGETYDFDFVPDAPGELRFTVTSGGPGPLISMPVRIR